MLAQSIGGGTIRGTLYSTVILFGFWNLVLAFFNFAFLKFWNLTSLLNWSILNYAYFSFLVQCVVWGLAELFYNFSPKYGQNSLGHFSTPVAIAILPFQNCYPRLPRTHTSCFCGDLFSYTSDIHLTNILPFYFFPCIQSCVSYCVNTAHAWIMMSEGNDHRNNVQEKP